MSIVDKVVAAVTPPESEEARKEARIKAESLARPGSWLAAVLDHHRQIEAGFAEVRGGTDAASRMAAQKRLAMLLTGHSTAEEAVLYPAMALDDQKAHAEMAYFEQSKAKIQMAALDPMSQDYLDKLEHLRGAVTHHVYQEEGTWYPKLMEEAAAGTATMLDARYADEFDRYCGTRMGSELGMAAGAGDRSRAASVAPDSTVHRAD
ncbi:MAG TPA: hemerythrin domain-containing protein [Burkholderiaceae bacterium]